MVDIDEILAEAIRNVDGPESQSRDHVEVEAAQCVRAAFERDGIIITPSHPMPEAAAVAPFRRRRSSMTGTSGPSFGRSGEPWTAHSRAAPNTGTSGDRVIGDVRGGDLRSGSTVFICRWEEQARGGAGL
jgi:hypothetical protein